MLLLMMDYNDGKASHYMPQTCWQLLSDFSLIHALLLLLILILHFTIYDWEK